MHLMKTGARALLLTLAAALLFACAGCGKKAAQPDEYGLAAEKSKLDGTDIGDDLQLVSTGRYAGMFVEDGSDKTVSDVFCIRVKNTGSSDVQYAHITLARGDERYEFDISTLPAGQTLAGARAQRADHARKARGADGDRDDLRRVYRAPVHARRPVHRHDERQHHHRDQQLRSDAAQVYVYYKNASGDMLLGGHHVPRGRQKSRRRARARAATPATLCRARASCSL